jgi:hypothetical protein
MRNIRVLWSESWVIALMSLAAACSSGPKPGPDPEPECHVDADCSGPHIVCDQDGGGVCACAAGYAQGTAGCAWVGVVKAPGFDAAHSAPADFAKWVADPGVAFSDEASGGLIDPGMMKWAGEAFLHQKGVTQGVKMPRYSRAEPLVGVVSYSGFRGDPMVGLGAAFTDARLASTSVVQSGDWSKARFCLGTGAYAPEASIGTGVEMPLSVLPTDISALGGLLSVDLVDVVPAMSNECPAPGNVTNGDAEGDGGWKFSSTNPSPETKLTDGVGENGSRAARLVLVEDRDSQYASVPLSIPVMTDMATPALSFFVRTSVGASMELSLDSLRLGQIAGTGADEIHKFCIPAPLRGIATHLQARLFVPHPSGTGADLESVLDSVQLTDEPSCGTDPAIADPGFEATTPGDPPGAFRSASVAVVSSPELAHSGVGALRVGVPAGTSNTIWRARIVPPDAPATDGPALSFYYRVKPSGVKLRVTGMTATPVFDDVWHRGVACLTFPAGRGYRDVSFILDRDGLDPLEPAYLDDLATTTDPACPVN